MDQAVKIATCVFSYARPGCQALFAFDNSFNHSCYAKDALLVENMNLGPGEKQPILRNGFNHTTQEVQSMVFPDDHLNPSLRGKPKGIKKVLIERGLWKTRRVDGFAFLLECPTTGNRPGCDPTLTGGCCARGLLKKQPDFQEQRGRLKEEIEATEHLVIFYPKFHFELNFIERYVPCLLSKIKADLITRFWCATKYYARENCEYNLKALCEIIPHALNSVSTSAIFHYYEHCIKIMQAYRDKHEYGTKQFSQAVYKTHRQVQDKSKW